MSDMSPLHAFMHMATWFLLAHKFVAAYKKVIQTLYSILCQPSSAAVERVFKSSFDTDQNQSLEDYIIIQLSLMSHFWVINFFLIMLAQMSYYASIMLVCFNFTTYYAQNYASIIRKTLPIGRV